VGRQEFCESGTTGHKAELGRHTSRYAVIRSGFQNFLSQYTASLLRKVVPDPEKL